MSKETRISYFDSQIVGESEKAVCVIPPDSYPSGNSFWIPKSQMELKEYDGNKHTCYLPNWLIEKNGMEELIDTTNEPGLFF